MLLVLILAGLVWACQCFRFWLLVGGFLVAVVVCLVLYDCLGLMLFGCCCYLWVLLGVAVCFSVYLVV